MEGMVRFPFGHGLWSLVLCTREHYTVLCDPFVTESKADGDGECVKVTGRYRRSSWIVSLSTAVC